MQFSLPVLARPLKYATVLQASEIQASEIQARSKDVSNPSNSYVDIFSLDNIPLALTITNMPNTAYSTSSMTYCAATRALRISSTEIQTYWSQVQGEPARSAVKTKELQVHCCYYHLPANSYFTYPQMKSEDEKRRWKAQMKRSRSAQSGPTVQIGGLAWFTPTMAWRRPSNRGLTRHYRRTRPTIIKKIAFSWKA